jgi:hypothetical protein
MKNGNEKSFRQGDSGVSSCRRYVGGGPRPDQGELPPVRAFPAKICARLGNAEHRLMEIANTLNKAGGGRRKIADNPMDQHVETRLRNLRCAARCGAKTRAGLPCQRPALRGRRRCRLHGGLSPGALCGAKNGNFRTGDWTAEAIEERKWLRSVVRAYARGGAAE